MAHDAANERPFKLIWTSRNEVVTLECGEFASIPEAAVNLPAAEALHAESRQRRLPLSARH